MGTTRTVLATMAAASALVVSAAACDPLPTAYTVTTTADTHDATPGDGTCEATLGAHDCSLRAAIEEGNAQGRASLTVPAGTYRLTLAGSQVGQPTLDITGKITINDGSPVAGVTIGNDEPNLNAPSPKPDGARVIVHEGAMLSLDGGTINRVRTGGLFVLNHGTVSSVFDTSSGALDVLPSGSALIVNSNVTTLGWFEVVTNTDAITNAGNLQLIHATVMTSLGGTGTEAVRTSGSGVTKARSTAFRYYWVFRGVVGTGGQACGGTTVVSQGYNYGAGPGCGLTQPGDLDGVPFGSPGAYPGADSPLVDAIPPGVNGCGTDFLTDIDLHARPLDGNGDGTLACDIGANERVG